MPENHFNAMPSSSVEVDDSSRLSLIMMGDRHLESGGDVMIPTGLNGLEQVPVLNPAQPSFPMPSGMLFFVDNILYHVYGSY